jgi:hypothetical protein
MATGAPDYTSWNAPTRSIATGGEYASQKTLTIPANTASGSPATDTITLVSGFLRQVDILFPPGCSALAYIQIFDGATQILPNEASVWFSGDSEKIICTLDHVLLTPFELTIKGYNDDDTYPHTPILRFYVVKYPT